MVHESVMFSPQTVIILTSLQRRLDKTIECLIKIVKTFRRKFLVNDSRLMIELKNKVELLLTIKKTLIERTKTKRDLRVQINNIIGFFSTKSTSRTRIGKICNCCN